MRVMEIQQKLEKTPIWRRSSFFGCIRRARFENEDFAADFKHRERKHNAFRRSFVVYSFAREAVYILNFATKSVWVLTAENVLLWYSVCAIGTTVCFSELKTHTKNINFKKFTFLLISYLFWERNWPRGDWKSKVRVRSSFWTTKI